MQNLTRVLLTASLAIFLLPVAGAQSLGVDLSAAASATGAASALGDAKAQAEGLAGEVQAKAEGAVADAQAKADALQAQVEAEAAASADEAMGFGDKAKAAFEAALGGLKGFAASIAAHLSVG